MTDRKTIQAYDAQVDNYISLTERQEPDPVLIAFIGRVRPGGLVLDLGCGPAQASVVMKQEGLQVDPVDASAEMVRVANDRYDIGARQLLFDELGGPAIYDGVWANFSLLHASREALPEHLKTLFSVMRPAAILHLGMKMGTGSRRDSLDRLYSYYTEQELVDHLTDNGFSVLDRQTGEALGLAGDVEPWITLTAQVLKG